LWRAYCNESKGPKEYFPSSTEDEHYATSEIAKEVLFVKNLLEEIEIQIQFPINIKWNNVGAILFANNHYNSKRSKHIDTRRHFVCKWVDNNILKIILTPTLESTAYIFAKNPTEEIFQKHAVKLVKTVPKETEMCNVTTFPSQDIILNLYRVNGL
jgi:hypothetical protein